jgi:hypothetical protein
MESSDMLDIIHVLYEEDSIPLYEDHAKIKSNVRSAIWNHIYEKEYPYPYTESADAGNVMSDGHLGPDEDLLPAEDAKPATKPYIPPTDPDQFAAIGLDAPFGGDR